MTHTIPSYVESIQSINLTLAGKIELSAFPKEAIEYTERVIQNKKNVTNLWALYYGIAKKFCTDNSIELDYTKISQLYMLNGIRGGASKLENLIINKIDTKKTKTTTQFSGDRDYVDLEEKKRLRWIELQEDMNRMKVTDPDKYERIRENERIMRKMIGIDDQGNILDESNPPTFSKFADAFSHMVSIKSLPKEPVKDIVTDEILNQLKDIVKERSDQGVTISLNGINDSLSDDAISINDKASQLTPIDTQMPIESLFGRPWETL